MVIRGARGPHLGCDKSSSRSHPPVLLQHWNGSFRYSSSVLLAGRTAQKIAEFKMDDDGQASTVLLDGRLQQQRSRSCRTSWEGLTTTLMSLRDCLHGAFLGRRTRSSALVGYTELSVSVWRSFWWFIDVCSLVRLLTWLSRGVLGKQERWMCVWLISTITLVSHNHGLPFRSPEYFV